MKTKELPADRGTFPPRSDDKPMAVFILLIHEVSSTALVQISDRIPVGPVTDSELRGSKFEGEDLNPFIS